MLNYDTASIGRGVRYFPFQLDEVEDKYKRKFDDDIENDMRIVETLHYHSAHNPDYISEIKSTLKEIGIIPETHVQMDLFIKPEFKKTEFWKNGVIFINNRIANPRTEIFSLDNAKIERNYVYRLRTGELKEEVVFDEDGKLRLTKELLLSKKKYKLISFGENIVRSALDKFEFYKFETLKKYFPHIKSVREFIMAENYLGGVEIEVSGPKDKLNKLMPIEKLEIALFVVKNIAEQARVKTSEFVGTNLFKARLLQQVFKDKKIKIDIDEVRKKELRDVNLAEKDWYAQNELYGTEEEQDFIKFIDGFIEKLRQKYSDIAIFRNEKFFQIFDFEQGRPFEPDFVMFLKKKNGEITIYQIFIEPKGDQFKDSQGRFEGSKEGWKQDFLLELENKADTDLKFESKSFKLIGLPFCNEKLKKEFEKTLENELLS